jgi:hypothetical protein
MCRLAWAISLWHNEDLPTYSVPKLTNPEVPVSKKRIRIRKNPEGLQDSPAYEEGYADGKTSADMILQDDLKKAKSLIFKLKREIRVLEDAARDRGNRTIVPSGRHTGAGPSNTSAAATVPRKRRRRRTSEAE